MASKNEHLVPGRDLKRYKTATVAGLKDQLLQNDLPTDGLKYDLYVRLRDAGLQLYTDRRSNAAAISPRISKSRRGRGVGERRPQDRGRSKTVRIGPGQGQGNPPRDDDDSNDDSDSDDVDDVDDVDDGDSSHDSGGGSPPGGGGGPPGGSPPDGGDSPGGSHDGGDDGDQGPPGPGPMPVGGVLPAGLQVQLIATLHPSALWNLITAAPDTFLSNGPAGFNAIRVEALYQHRLDHPGAAAPPPVGLGLDPGLGQAPVGPGMGAAGDLHVQIGIQADQAPVECSRPVSLLQWVGKRASTDTQFRVANRTLIRRVINEYLTAYGAADPPAGVDNSRDDILYYFRDRADLAGQSTILGRAIRRNEMRIVHLLIAHGADVNQVVNGTSVVDEAAESLSMDQRRLKPMFALLAAGANVGNLAQETLDEVSTMMQNVTGNPFWGNDADYVWPRIDNLLALPARQFLGDGRSPLADRTMMAMFLLWEGHDNYPWFL